MLAGKFGIYSKLISLYTNFPAGIPAWSLCSPKGVIKRRFDCIFAFRNHNLKGVPDHDPGKWPSVANATRIANLFRYRHLPYLYR
jgi:hypothetical protein